MYTDDDLDRAVAAGALAPEAAAAFRAFVARETVQPAVDEEHFRLLTGFNDIFVSVAATLILIAVGWLGNTLDGVLGGAAVAVTSWGLAEYFTRRRRMALPSILLLLAFVGGIYGAALAALMNGDFTFRADAGLRVGGAAALAALAAWLHWRRFMVPITVAAGTGAALVTVLAVIFGSNPDLVRTWAIPAVFVAGLAAFAFAMWWDSRDRARTTRRSDVAFWLHLGAAPLMVHPVFAGLGLLGGDASLGRAGAAVGIYVVLALVALAIDRRALLISALAYVLYAISALFQAAGSLSESLALTALVIGSALLMLSAFWHRARRAVVRVLPSSWQTGLPLVDGR